MQTSVLCSIVELSEELSVKAGFSLNDVRAPSRHASLLTLQGYLDQHNVAKTKRVIADLVAGALTQPTHRRAQALGGRSDACG